MSRHHGDELFAVTAPAACHHNLTLWIRSTAKKSRQTRPRNDEWIGSGWFGRRDEEQSWYSHERSVEQPSRRQGARGRPWGLCFGDPSASANWKLSSRSRMNQVQIALSTHPRSSVISPQKSEKRPISLGATVIGNREEEASRSFAKSSQSHHSQKSTSKAALIKRTQCGWSATCQV